MGRGVAHDEYIPFKVQKGKLVYNDEESDILGGKIRVEFIKGYRDNPKVNAIAVIKGRITGTNVKYLFHSMATYAFTRSTLLPQRYIFLIF